jgi:hypothetical protein
MKRMPYGYQVTEADLVVVSLIEDRGKYEGKICRLMEQYSVI